MLTIVAAATPPAAGGVGILRISGPEALALGRPLARGLPEHPQPRHAYLVDFVDGAGALLDVGLFLYFQAPRSFTGEDVVELHVHGSPRLLQLLQSQVLEAGDVRVALPGEFTRRAFLNGRIDLLRAEAVADLVSADSDAAVRAAAAQLAGGLSTRIAALRAPLLALRTELEGVLNFPDEAEGADEGFEHRLLPLLEQARSFAADARRGRLVRRGARVVLYGPVNAGKSTLFNRLIGEDRALVDADPGTTRDVLEARLELEGLTVSLQDTAGLRTSPGRLEAMGMARAREAIRSADLLLLVLPPDVDAAASAEWRVEAGEVPVLVVRSKADVAKQGAADAASADDLRVSAHTGEGLEALRRRIHTALWGSGAASAGALISERHADALRRAIDALERAAVAHQVSTLEVVSGELGLALDALGEITGEAADAALLDAIFQRFCIGK